MQYRKGIPEKLRPYFNGKREIKESFKTADPATARILHHELSAKVEAQLASAWAQFKGELTIEASRLHRMADTWFDKKLNDLKTAAKRDEMVVESEIPRGDGRAPVLDREHVWSLSLQTPPEANSLSHLRAVLDKEAEGLLRQMETALRQDSELYHKLLILMADRALQIAGQAGKTQDDATPTFHSSDNLLIDSPTLSEVWLKFESHYENSGDPKDKRKVSTYQSDFSKLIQHTGNPRLSMLNREHALSFRDAMRAAPNTTAKGFNDQIGMPREAFNKLSLDEQCEIASEKNLQVRTASGVKSALKRVAAVLAWFDRERRTKYNVFKPIPEVPNSQTANRGEAFEYSKDEIRTLLTSDKILGALSVDELWCMLTLYYTGARLREVTPMLGADLLIVDGNAGLHIREDHALGRTVKNSASIREVPVHPHLKELGFLRFAQREPTEALFPELWDTTGNRANKFSRKLKSLGIENGLKATIRPSHGFRHHVIGLWREAEKRQDLQDAYLGHGQKSQQARYSNFSSVADAAVDVWPDLPDKQKLMTYLWPDN